MIDIRKHLHAYPELSNEETNTSQFIFNFLKERTKANEVLRISTTGILAVFLGKQQGKSILLRADIDALPIEEINPFKHRSTVLGVSHKCGHDGHTTILLGVALELSKKPVYKGKVYLLFQPAEEIGIGAKTILSTDFFKEISIDYVFALHNLPGFPLHQIVIKQNVFTAYVVSMIIKIKGKTSHAAEPEHGKNPANALAQIIKKADNLVYNNPSSANFFLITPIFIHLGDLAYGVSAGAGEIHFTIRAWDKELATKQCSALEDFIKEVCFSEKLNFTVSWTQEFEATVNNNEAVDLIKQSAQKKELSLNELNTPFKWGEDFGLFTSCFKGAMFGIGSGEKSPALHNPDYDFPDEIIATGITLFYEILNQANECP